MILHILTFSLGPAFAADTHKVLTLYLIGTPFITFANRADPDQAALTGSTLFAYVNMIRYDPTLLDLTNNFFVQSTNVKVYLYNYS